MRCYVIQQMVAQCPQGGAEQAGGLFLSQAL